MPREFKSSVDLRVDMARRVNKFVQVCTESMYQTHVTRLSQSSRSDDFAVTADIDAFIVIFHLSVNYMNFEIYNHHTNKISQNILI